MLRMYIEEEFKTNIRESWEKITLDEIKSCISTRRKRLRTISTGHWGPIGHLYKQTNGKITFLHSGSQM